MGEFRFVIVTGLSGAGKSEAMNALEDLGYHCVDNFPPILIPAFLEVMQRAGIERLALGLDVMTGGPVGEAVDALRRLDSAGVSYDVLFLEAQDDVLVRRYSETRRKHPRSQDGRVLDWIAAERRSLLGLRECAGRIWDTSQMLTSALKDRIRTTYSFDSVRRRLRTIVLAFGFKFGVPADADLVFDARFLKNPNYVPELQPLTGADEAVEEYMRALPATAAFLDQLYAFIDFCIPQFIEEGKTSLTIGIGCTGGRHRSIYIARRLNEHLTRDTRVSSSLVYRDVAVAHA